MNLYEYQRSSSFIDLGPMSLRFTFSNVISLETAWQIEAIFHVKTPWDRGMKVCSTGLGHITNMAAMPIYDNNLKKIFSGTKQPMTLKAGMPHRVFKYFQVCSNDDLGLTLTYFTARSNLIPYAFVSNIMDFSETILVYVIKVGRFIQLNEYMNL